MYTCLCAYIGSFISISCLFGEDEPWWFLTNGSWGRMSEPLMLFCPGSLASISRVNLDSTISSMHWFMLILCSLGCSKDMDTCDLQVGGLKMHDQSLAALLRFLSQTYGSPPSTRAIACFLRALSPLQRHSKKYTSRNHQSHSPELWWLGSNAICIRLCHSGRYHMQSGGLFGAWKWQEPGFPRLEVLMVVFWHPKSAEVTWLRGEGMCLLVFCSFSTLPLYTFVKYT